MKFSILYSALLLASLTACSNNAASISAPVVLIDGGQVQGVVEGNSIVYKGIPYAAPPVGELRWKDPLPVKPWDTLMIADHFRNAAPQAAHDVNDGNYGTEFFAEDAPFSEDCLHLNIWTPSPKEGQPSEKLPVALWIHGGGYQSGWSFEPEMDGQAWADRGVILVTANYRLGIFGYLSHPLLTAESGTSGNYGLKDQIAALKWVKRNIAQFGGDPEKVMIFGQSAGGGSVRCMVISPESRDLISSATIMSAGGLGSALRSNSTQTEYDALGQEIMDIGGFTTLESMRAASYEELMGAMTKYMKEKKTFLMLGPHIDGKVLVEDFDDAVYANHISQVPMMVGSVANDMLGLEQGFPQFAQVRDSLDCPATYIYRFDAPLPTDGRPALEGSFHSSELWYVFHTLSRSWRPFAEADEELSHRMVGYWTNMAKYGNPNGAEAGSWLPAVGTDPYVQQLKRK